MTVLDKIYMVGTNLILPSLFASTFVLKQWWGFGGGVEGGNFYRGKSFQSTQHVAQILFLPNVFL